MSLVSQNDTKCKRHFIQRIYHSQLVWEPDKKNPKGKNYEKVYIRTIEKKYFLASYKISLRLTHYTLFLA